MNAQKGFTVVEEHQVNYPILMANANVKALYGGIQSIPTTFVLDQGRHHPTLLCWHSAWISVSSRCGKAADAANSDIRAIYAEKPMAPTWGCLLFGRCSLFSLFLLLFVLSHFSNGRRGVWGVVASTSIYNFLEIGFIILNADSGWESVSRVIVLLGINIGPLYAVFQIGKEKKGWTQLE